MGTCKLETTTNEKLWGLFQNDLELCCLDSQAPNLSLQLQQFFRQLHEKNTNFIENCSPQSAYRWLYGRICFWTKMAAIRLGSSKREECLHYLIQSSSVLGGKSPSHFHWVQNGITESIPSWKEIGAGVAQWLAC